MKQMHFNISKRSTLLRQVDCVAMVRIDVPVTSKADDLLFWIRHGRRTRHAVKLKDTTCVE